MFERLVFVVVVCLFVCVSVCARARVFVCVFPFNSSQFAFALDFVSACSPEK